MLRYRPEINNYIDTEMSVMNLFLYYGIIIFSYICLFLSHKEYIKSTPDFKFKDLLLLSFLLVCITYCMVYLVGTLNFHLFYKKFISTETKTGLQGLFDTFSQPSAPEFSPFFHLISNPIRSIIHEVKELQIWTIVYDVITTKVGGIFVLIYFEALYFLFNKYKHTKAFFVLPLINKWKLIEITQKPKWYFFVLLIPFVRLVPLFNINKQIAKDFGRETSFALGLTFLPSIFYGILGLSSNEQPVFNKDLNLENREEHSII
jgi:Family of unknown function (DUF5684)